MLLMGLREAVEVVRVAAFDPKQTVIPLKIRGGTVKSVRREAIEKFEAYRTHIRLSLVDKHLGSRLDALANYLRTSCCLEVIWQQRERLSRF